MATWRIGVSVIGLLAVTAFMGCESHQGTRHDSSTGSTSNQRMQQTTPSQSGSMSGSGVQQSTQPQAGSPGQQGTLDGRSPMEHSSGGDKIMK